MGSGKGRSRRAKAAAQGSKAQANATSKLKRMSSVELADALDIKRYTGDLAAVDAAVISRMAAHMRAREDFAEYTPAAWDKSLFWNAADAPAERSQFYTIGNAINFRFWELEDGELTRSSGKIGGEKFGGAMYMWRALRRSLEDGRVPLLDASFLANMSREDFDLIFNDDEGNNPLAVGAEERIANLRNLGAELQLSWNGQFLNVANAAHGSLTEFARLSKRFRAFDDPVYKLTMLNAIMHTGSGVNRFRAQ